MDAKDIQKILEEQRKNAKVHQKTERQITNTIAAYFRSKNPNWQENQKKAGHQFKKGINNAIERMGGYDLWKKQHQENMKKLGQKRKSTTEYKEKIGPKISAAWQDPIRKEERKKVMKEGWNKPGVRENKSRSVKEVLSRPGAMEALKQRAKINGKKTSRPCVSPEGIFANKNMWAKVSGFSPDLFGYRCRKMPDQYYFITQEEYKRLTGKEVWED